VGGLALLVACALSGCSSGPVDSPATGGTPGGTGGVTSTGGASSTGGNKATGGATGGNSATGGSGTGGAAGGAATGGKPATGGATSTGGAGGQGIGGQGGGVVATGGSSGGSSGGGGSGAAVASMGCGKAPTLKNSPATTANYNNVTVGSATRKYILRYPENYDKDHPYRLVIAYHWYSGSASQVFDCTTESIRCYTTQSPFYGMWNLANNSTIFIAPEGTGNPLGWSNTNGADVAFTDELLKQVEADLCIDNSRVFANGFSFGSGMSFALACERPDVFRAVGIYSGGQLSGCKGGTKPVAYYASHGEDDGTLGIAGGRTMRDQFVKNNGCNPMTPPEPADGSKTHICTSYEGCSPGHPVRWCAFDGSNGHDPSPKDPGQSMTWNPAEAWKFFTQF